MMTYKDWQMLQESSFTLGLRSPKALGIKGSKLSEMGFPPAGPEEEDDNQDPMIDDMGSDEPAPMDMGGGMDAGMGGGNKIVLDMDKLGPLLQALGIDISGPAPDLGGGDADAQVGSEDGVDLDTMFAGGDEGGADDEGGASFPPTAGGDKAPFPAADADAESEEDGDAASPFGGDSEDEVEGDEESDDEGSVSPFVKKGGSEDADADEESDEEVEDDEDAEEDKPSPKFMHKGKKKEFMCGKCGNITKEEASIFDSIIKNGRGNHKQKNSGGVGFAPQGRIGGMR